ncbi:uncharacterized protein LOC113463307 isoform X1 [Phoenix dactylifera]|uniref:Uncharacterized protein LOC113463307 isoform X1 n=1 Tax=Phoenix dactylifera TaxID=42345 RepID=A0A8B8J9C1_PHODC|nr:uncharacterized protein LOC113463307 isoform X1 [Phoenix dactylifera]XP_026663876.2 uncharacterized protein LOC113463307 isoform X1 [Phoenix dactylifera]
MVGHAHEIPLEVVGTMIEMADVAWSALEYRRERKAEAAEEDEISHLKAENLRLRTVLADNLAVLQGLYKSPSVSNDCPPDLYTRLVAAVDSSSFLTKLESLHQESTDLPNDKLPSSEPIGANLNGVEIMVDEIVPDCLEEVSGIDNESYVIISEENVVEGIAHFIASCILENPKSKVLTPEELQRTVTRALGGIKDRSKWRNVWEAGRIIYTLSTWGIALAGIYRHRAILKAAAKGVSASANLALKAL